MNSIDIERVLFADPWTGKRFRGVYPKDVVGEVLRRSGSGIYVFNTHPAGMPGEHWIGISIQGNRAYYFDSYGRHPSNYPAVVRSIADLSSTIVWNDVRLQGLTTTVCGDYCVVFSLLIGRGWTLHEIVSLLSRFVSTEHRDHGLRRLLVHLYGRRFISSNRNQRAGLVGIDNIHVRVGVETLGYI